MHKKNIIKLLKLQSKNIILDNLVVDSKSNTTLIFVHKKISQCSCPSCASLTDSIHDYREQKIKHVPVNGFKTFLVLTKARLVCPNCGNQFDYNYNDIVNPKFRCSNALFLKIIDDLQNTSMSIKEIAAINFVSPGVVTRYLNYFSFFMQWNNITELPEHIGIDEFKGNCDKNKYQFHVYDLDTKSTIQILKARTYDEIFNFFKSITNRNDVKLVTMDLYAPFRNAVHNKLKKANIIADPFHYTRIVSSALDELRINIWRNTKGIEKKYFKGIKRTLLKDIEKIKPENLLKFEEHLNYALNFSGELKYGYELYQQFLRIKDADSFEEKCKLFNNWILEAQSSTLPSFESAANTLQSWYTEIINSFKYPYSNGRTEGKNNKIKVIKRIAYGYTNLNNFRNRIKIRDLQNQF